MSRTKRAGNQLAAPGEPQRRFQSVAEIKRELFPCLRLGKTDDDSPARQLADLFDNYVAHKSA